MNDLVELLRKPTEPYGYQSQLACEAADTIESLRAQVTAEQLKAAILRTEVNELRRERAFNERLARDLAAAQAQVAALTKDREQERATTLSQFSAIGKELAAMTKERDRWQQAYDRCNDVCRATEECWNADIALAQAENVQLRDFVETVRELATIETPTAVIQALNALDLHTYHTAALYIRLMKIVDAAKELIAYSDTGGDDKPYPYIFWDDKFKALEVALKELEK
jgi:chromosome segregation ATPase